MLSFAQPQAVTAKAGAAGKAAQEAVSAPRYGAEPDWLIVGRNSRGCWVVRDRFGLKGGIFASFGAALQFAKEEAAAAHSSVILTPALEFEFDL